MHACGHDCHTSMLLGAAKILSAHRDEIHGTVKLIFQMAEEIGRKSEEYVKRGALEGVDAIFGMHIWSAVPAGKVNLSPASVWPAATVLPLKSMEIQSRKCSS